MCDGAWHGGVLEGGGRQERVHVEGGCQEGTCTAPPVIALLELDCRRACCFYCTCGMYVSIPLIIYPQCYYVHYIAYNMLNCHCIGFS